MNPYFIREPALRNLCFVVFPTLIIFLTDLDISYGEYNHSVRDPIDWLNLDRLRNQLSITAAALSLWWAAVLRVNKTNKDNQLGQSFLLLWSCWGKGPAARLGIGSNIIFEQDFQLKTSQMGRREGEKEGGRDFWNTALKAAVCTAW